MLRNLSQPCALIRLMMFAIWGLSLKQLAVAQRADIFIPQRVLAILHPDADAHAMAAQLFPGQGVRVWETAKFMRVWAFELEGFVRADDYLEAFWAIAEHPMTLAAQHDMRLEHRNLDHLPDSLTPNDPLYVQQWHLNNPALPDADINAPAAWSIATGGISTTGDTIVAAVIDRGIAATHPDLHDNLWRNWADYPGDGIDNDNNGYVDDHWGWNVFSQNDQIAGSAQGHGTRVCGLLGALGDNETGISGVNWRVKILFVAGSGTLSAVLQSFDYVYQTRKRYNETGGVAGAFVTTLNCSWGINFGQPADAPLWCAAYDSLGAIGILSVGATANQPIDVDLHGDLPTSCPSDYLISVTNLDRYNQRAPNAAWGRKHVDIGAYGHEALTTAAPNTYDLASGTSFAAPLVAGGIALLYAVPCPDLALTALKTPAAAALRARQALLDAARPVAALEGITTTGGALDLHKLLLRVQSECGTCLPPVWTSATASEAEGLTVSWINADPETETFVRFRLVGDDAWTETPLSTSPFVFDGLIPCATYELSFRNQCFGSPPGPWSAPVVATNAGCCTMPEMLAVVETGEHHASLKWVGPGVAEHYNIRYRTPGEDWLYAQSPSPEWTLTELAPCALYEIQVEATCADGAHSEWSAFAWAATKGCGPCTDQTYCAGGSGSAQHQWIRQVSIGSWVHKPNTNHSGYLSYADLLTTSPALSPLEAYPIQVVPAFQGAPTKQFFRVYVDYNGDGTFSDDELAFDPGFTLDETAAGWLYTPGFTGDMFTRIRIVMKRESAFSQPPKGCETFSFGQTVDYCVRLESGGVATQDPAPAPFSLFPNPSPGVFWLKTAHQTDILVAAFDAMGRAVFFEKKQAAPDLWHLDLSQAGPGVYFLKINDGDRSTVARVVVTGQGW